jgi:hypothetical protein
MQQSANTPQLRIVGIGGKSVSDGPDWLKRGLVCVLATAVLAVALVCVLSRRSTASRPQVAMSTAAGSLWAE